MKISASTMQIYSIDRPRSPVSEPEVRSKQPTQFSQARFAELLSAEEKSFISRNFKAEVSVKSASPQLGRHLDVIA